MSVAGNDSRHPGLTRHSVSLTEWTSNVVIRSSRSEREIGRFRRLDTSSGPLDRLPYESVLLSGGVALAMTPSAAVNAAHHETSLSGRTRRLRFSLATSHSSSPPASMRANNTSSARGPRPTGTLSARKLPTSHQHPETAELEGCLGWRKAAFMLRRR